MLAVTSLPRPYSYCTVCTPAISQAASGAQTHIIISCRPQLLFYADVPEPPPRHAPHPPAAGQPAPPTTIPSPAAPPPAQSLPQTAPAIQVEQQAQPATQPQGKQAKQAQRGFWWWLRGSGKGPGQEAVRACVLPAVPQGEDAVLWNTFHEMDEGGSRLRAGAGRGGCWLL